MSTSIKGWWWAMAAGCALGIVLVLRARTTRPTPRLSPDANVNSVSGDTVPDAALGPSIDRPSSTASIEPTADSLAFTANSVARAAPPGPDELVAGSASSSVPRSATSDPSTLARAERPRPTSKPRRVALAPLAAWSMPGLCSRPADAAAMREKLTAKFRRFDGGERGRLYLDPRLPEGAEAGVLASIEQAQLVVNQRLGVQPSPPLVFAYFDQELMKAAACINEDVVAFYDGALHLVAGREDLQQSVIHEYAHHAMFASGLTGPAWAQEGIAMIMARETWWQRPSRLQALLQTSFSVEDAERLIPYKLPAEQALSFYVQSALTVQCLRHLRGWSLRDLADALRIGHRAGSVSYDFPELEQSSFLSNCVATLSAISASK